MKKLFLALFLVLVLVGTATAEGIYQSVIDGQLYQIVFRAGPFSPGEQGTATVYADDKLFDEYQYHLDTDDGIYTVFGLCKFRASRGLLIPFKDIPGIIFTTGYIDIMPPE